MNVIHLVRSVVVGAAGVVLVLLLSAGTASAATTLVLDPSAAAPGTRVTIYNACFGVTDHPAKRLRAAFVSSATPQLSPTDSTVSRAVANASGAGTYTVIVPDLDPGSYDIRLECLPGNWLTNVAEGASLPLTVLAGAPSTSTDQEVADRRPAGNPLDVPLLIVLTLAGGIAGDRWLLKRRSQRSTPPDVPLLPAS